MSKTEKTSSSFIQNLNIEISDLYIVVFPLCITSVKCNHEVFSVCLKKVE